ncbi:alkaline shock response membrane anchor protein AmaP [Actinosynnema sp. NPDC051121]|uniref:alkaline shock response membrane anchor protein AmaP n=1 Tax=Saccharothrix sp. TaxID=1873460 RepID=UPI0028126512|nr:alkaline shock response membrane anchor protein AmaP [Saccharothrix sp.]
MSGRDRPSGLNRAVLALTGLLLLAAGGFALATRFALLDLLAPDAPLVPGDAPPPTWVWWAVAAGAVVLGLLAVRWLAAQADRTPKTRTWRSDTGGSSDTSGSATGGRTELAAGTAVAPLLAEIETYPGVHAAHGTLAGIRDEPRLALVVTTDQDGEPGAIRHALVTRGLPRLRQALDLDELPTAVEFRFTDKPALRAATSPHHRPGAGT